MIKGITKHEDVLIHMWLHRDIVGSELNCIEKGEYTLSQMTTNDLAHSYTKTPAGTWKRIKLTKCHVKYPMVIINYFEYVYDVCVRLRVWVIYRRTKHSEISRHIGGLIHHKDR